jgi:hypothetical protein
MNHHIGDDAESYALGLLEPERRAEIDAHVASCRICLRLLGEAEETAAALATTLPPAASTRRSARPTLRSGLAGIALAAALVLALAASLYQNALLRGEVGNERLAVATLVHSHFLHVTMTVAPGNGALAAKVVYARDGSWLYVLADKADATLDVEADIAGRPWSGGRLNAEGDTATALLRPPGRPSAVRLTYAGRTVAVAKLAY